LILVATSQLIATQGMLAIKDDANGGNMGGGGGRSYAV